jgi:hypothetical protein
VRDIERFQNAAEHHRQRGKSVASTEQVAPPSNEEPKRLRRSRSNRIVLGVALAAALGLCWLGFKVWQTYDALDRVKTGSEAAKAQLLSNDPEAAHQLAGEAQAAANDAAASTHSLTWRTAASVPLLGSPFRSVRDIADVAVELTSRVLVPAVDTGEALAPANIVGEEGKVNLGPLRDAGPALDKIALSALDIADMAKNVQVPTYLGSVANAREELISQTDALAKLLSNSAIAAKIAPSMLGIDGPRSYFVGFQTNAEARGTGGLVGGFGIVRAADGRVLVDKLAKNTSIPYEGLTPIDLGPNFSPQWIGNYAPTTDIRNSNFSANFPFAARIWQSLWRQQSGEVVDGAIATDPVALSYVLSAVGPVKLTDGEEIRADNVVELTMSTSYLRFADDNEARKQYLQDVASAVVSKMTEKIESPQRLLDALGRAASEGRIAIWSADPILQDVLARTKLGHVVPDDDAPYAAVVINNQAGNKLDYYLKREIEYSAGNCDADTRSSKVTVRLTNTATEVVKNYPDYVAGRFNRSESTKGTDFPVVTLYATKNSKLIRILVDGKATPISLRSMELGRPMFTVPTQVPIGKSVVLEFELSEPTAPGEARVPVQPLVDEPVVAVSVPICGN